MPKKWPADDEPASFEDITRPLARAVRFAYNLKRKNRDKDIPWTGLDVGPGVEHVSFGAAKKLAASNLKYSEEEQGRDALEELLGLAVQLGIEQGRRIAVTGPEFKTLKIKLQLAKLGVHLDDEN